MKTVLTKMCIRDRFSYRFPGALQTALPVLQGEERYYLPFYQNNPGSATPPVILFISSSVVFSTSAIASLIALMIKS